MTIFVYFFVPVVIWAILCCLVVFFHQIWCDKSLSFHGKLFWGVIILSIPWGEVLYYFVRYHKADYIEAHRESELLNKF